MRYFLTLIVFCTFLFSRAGDVVKYGDLFFEIDEDSKTAKVTYNEDENRYSFSHVDIPEVIEIENVEYSVTTIGENAFARCENLKTITIPPTVKRLENFCFIYSGLTSISFPDSIEYMGIYLFQDCHELSGEIILPKLNKDVPDGCFKYCDKITSIVIPPALRAFCKESIDGCTGLQKIEISDLESWFNIHFSDDLRNNNPLQYAHHLYLNGEELTNLEIPESVTKIKSYAFYGCTSLERVYFPNSVTEIEKSAFTDCINIKEINLPYSLEKLGETAFYNCKSIKSIELPQLTEIKENTFGKCEQLEEIFLPNTLTKIKSNAFNGCRSLKKIVIPPSLKIIYPGAFENCDNLKTLISGFRLRTIESRNFNSLTEIYLASLLPPEIAGPYVFKDFTASIYVLPQTESLYKEMTPWMNFTDIRTLNVPDELVVNRSSISGYKGDKILINAALVPSKGINPGECVLYH